jgi:acetylornithine deacetylase/succinyl-diaminopimelate desuccinylase-like protein
VSLREHVARAWSADILPSLCDYIRIPALSADFDPDWKTHGHLDEAVELIRAWCAARPIAGLTVEVMELPGRTPLIFCEVPAFAGGNPEDTVLLYGHCDKQPEMTGWRDDLGPWLPVVEGDRLYGRGGADDGYAAYSSLLAIEAAQAAGFPHTRLIVLIEASEESGSPDLPAYLAALSDRVGSPTLVLCLDSECLDHDRLWVTTSLRGMVAGVLRVDVLTEGVHSGSASGVVPSSFRIARQLLDRIEDSATGELLLPELHVEVPADRVAQATATAAGYPVVDHFPWAGATEPMSADHTAQWLARTWRPTLSITGVDGIPPAGRAGNVLRPYTALKLSFRLPPTADPKRALAAIRERLLADPPHGATVQLLDTTAEPGWNAPAATPWLQTALDEASSAVFGNVSMAFGEGGSIPFMGMLGEMFPEAQYVITGALGPGANAHGPNEFLHLPTAVRLTECLSLLLRAHASR